MLAGILGNTLGSRCSVGIVGCAHCQAGFWTARGYVPFLPSKYILYISIEIITSKYSVISRVI